MATHDLKPKDVTVNLDVQFLLKKKGENDKHKKGQEESVPESEQDQSGKET